MLSDFRIDQHTARSISLHLTSSHGRSPFRGAGRDGWEVEFSHIGHSLAAAEPGLFPPASGKRWRQPAALFPTLLPANACSSNTSPTRHAKSVVCLSDLLSIRTLPHQSKAPTVTPSFVSLQRRVLSSYIPDRSTASSTDGHSWVFFFFFPQL